MNEHNLLYIFRINKQVLRVNPVRKTSNNPNAVKCRSFQYTYATQAGPVFRYPRRDLFRFRLRILNYLLSLGNRLPKALIHSSEPRICSAWARVVQPVRAQQSVSWSSFVYCSQAIRFLLSILKIIRHRLRINRRTMLSNLHTDSVGCAPTPNQYLTRDRSMEISLNAFATFASSSDKLVGFCGRGL